MKKISFKNLLKILPAIFALISGVCLFSKNKSYAEELTSLPSYFSVYTASYNNDTYTKISNDTFENGDAIFLQNNQAVVLEFEKSKLLKDDDYIVKQVYSVITINDQLLSVEPNKSNGFDNIDGEIYKLAINPYLLSSPTDFQYGKYSITFSYHYLDVENNFTEKTLSFTCDFYIFNYDEYCSSSAKYFSKNKTNGAYYYNYKNEELINFTYDYTRFNVNITKVYQQLSYTTTIKYVNGKLNIVNLDENGAQTTSNYVLVDKVNESTSARITFKDLGTYYISYETVNPYNNQEVFDKYFNLIIKPNETDTVNVFGYQAFYTSQNGLQEFKKLDETNSSKVTNQADITAKNNIEENIISLIKQNQIEIVKTNQAPIYFLTNATINPSNCAYWYFTNKDIIKDLYSLPTDTNIKNSSYKVENYSCSPLSTQGIYLVKVAYTFDKLPSGEEQYQYFLFEITTDSPKVTIQTNSNTPTQLSTDQITFSDVIVKKSTSGIFDSESILKIYSSTNFSDDELNTSTGEIVENEIVLETSGKYKVELIYGNKGQKKYISYFTIDKTGINDVSISSLVNYSGALFTKDKIIDSFFVNTPIAISWDNKEAYGKAKTFAEYKFFPTNYSSSFVSTLTSEQLKNYYNSPYTTYGIPSTDTFSYSFGNLPVATYSNTINMSTLGESNILSSGGLYIIKIYDETALENEIIGSNVIYKVVFIDTTKTNIVTQIGDTWSLAKGSKITTVDYTLNFGSHKLIQFENLLNINECDEWFNAYIKNDENYSKYLISYKNKYYLRIDTIDTIFYQENSNGVTSKLAYNLNASNNYSITEKAYNQSIPNESQYIFYFASSSNINIENNFDSFSKYSDSSHMVTFSTDNSQMRFYYKNESGEEQDLQQFSVAKNKNNDTKQNYYQPTAKTTLSSKSNGETLKFTYNVNSAPAFIVSEIKMEYYSFEKSENPELNTYIFKTTPTSSIYVYQKDGINLGTAIPDSVSCYEWVLNVENYNITATQTGTRTKAGKYVITRTYIENGDENDPKNRILTFIVDRNGIISAPEIDEQGNAIYYTGGGIKLQVLNNYQTIDQDKTLFFHDIYFASQMSQNSGTANPVLTTNLLPVTIYIPAYKYGFETFNTNTYNFNYSQNDIKNEDNSESSIVEYYDIETETYKPYEFYKLSAYVEYRETNNLSTKYLEIYNFSKVLSNNYLTSENSDGILTFDKEGYYHVVITSYAGDSFSFDFRIEYEEPSYEILDDKNNALTFENGAYYTNKSTIRIAWEDSASKYLANINKNEINYVVSNGITGKIDASKINQSGENSYYVDLNLLEINGAYTHESEIDITLQFNGNKDDYNNKQYFSKTSKIIIDLEAPITNVANLVSQTGLSFNTLREYASNSDNKYNMSKTSGLYAYYSFVLDASNFLDILKTPAQTNYDFYKAYYRVFDNNGINTKYILGNTQESEIYLDNYNDTLTNLLFKSNLTYEYICKEFVGKYVEIIEEDYAGNRTVFTIYISNLKESNHTAVEYKTLTSSTGDTSNNLKFNELQESLNIYSKYSLNINQIDLLNNQEYINNKYYQLISVNGVLYVKTPFSGNNYYKAIDYIDAEISKQYTLQELTTITSSSSAQQIILYSVPSLQQVILNAYVLNKMLDYTTLAQFEGTQLVEGIMIKLPTQTADSNIIYATRLNISGVVGGTKISPILIDDSNFFTEVQPEITVPQNYKISYVDGPNGEKYFRLEIIKNLNKNDYFIYTITDNFGEVVKVPHIYGQVEINNPITSDGEIITSYNQDGSFVYYSSENITYRYDTTIYSSAVVSVHYGDKNLSYIITKKGSNAEVRNSGSSEIDKTYIDYFSCSLINGSIMALELKQAIIDSSSNTWGNYYQFEVKLTLNDDFVMDEETNTTVKNNFNIYNKVPQISLLGANADDVTSILGNKGVYTNTITVNYQRDLLDFPYELYIITPDGSVLALTDEYTAKDNGTYSIIVNYLGDLKGLSKTLKFTIKNTSQYKFSVMKINSDGSYTEIQSTGASYSYKEGSVTKTEQNHYIVNGDYNILLNESLSLICETIKKVDDYTTIYIIHTDYNNPSIIEFFSCQIAITKIPETYSIFKENGFGEYDSKGKLQDLTKQTSTTSSILTKDGYLAGRKVAWQKYYLIPENKITATIYYGEIGKTVFTPVITETNDYYTINLKTSGVYYFKFQDLAGNSHFFGTYLDTEYFAIKYLSSVIFEINNESPINYAIYDKEITVNIPNNTLSYYDTNARPSINVELNGTKLDVITTSEYKWKFSEAGLYKIWFSAKIGGESIYEAPLYFTILSSNESRIVFNYNSYGNYYIEDVLLNGVSVNSKLANINNGELYNNKYLKELTLHQKDIKTGEGVWTFVINANNEFKQKFTFTIWINNPVVPINISKESGSTTSDNITITFLASNMLSQVGDCILKISGMEDLVITKETLENGTLQELNEITLTQSREYFIEVTTLSGQLLFSSYINKTEPLNTVSIILIIVVSIVAIAGTIIFILMRKKMKIK